MEPALGQIVQYVLTEVQAARINKRRDDFREYLNKNKPYTWDGFAREPGEPGQTGGHVGHYGSPVQAGDVLAAVITRLGKDAVNVKVFLDGNDDFYVPWAERGTEQGQWNWIPGASYGRQGIWEG